MGLRYFAKPLVAAAAILTAAATSCSSSGIGAETAASAACETPGITTDEVDLGFVYSSSGGGSTAFASARSGFDARLGLANEQGGVHGRNIAYQWRDDESSQSTNARVARELIEIDSVFGLVEISSVVAESMDYLAEVGVPVTGLAAEPAWGEHPNMFSFMYSASTEIVGHYVADSGGTSVAIVTTSQSAVGNEAAARVTAALQAVGLTDVVTIPYSANSDSPERVARQIAESGADALISLLGPNDFAVVLQAVRAANLQLAAAVTLTGYDRGLLAALGPALAGVSMPVFFRPFEAGGSANERFHDAMTRFAPQTMPQEQQSAMLGYIYADMMLTGLDLAGSCPTREGVINALRGLSDYDAGGLIEPTALSDNLGKPITCHAFVQVNADGSAFEVTRERLCADGSGA